jgi:hypothetical protein
VDGAAARKLWSTACANSKRETLTFQYEKLRETATLVATGLKSRPQTEWQTRLDQLAATGKVVCHRGCFRQRPELWRTAKSPWLRPNKKN